MRSSSRRWPTRPSCSRRTRPAAFAVRRVEAHADDPARIGIDCFERPARRMSHAFALRRDVAGEQEDQPADRVDFVLFRATGGHRPLGPAPRARAGRRLPTGPRRASSACRASASSCSSSMSPTISSTTSSIVTRPSVPPNSSTTIARWMRWCRMRARSSITPIDSGTNSGSRISAATERSRARIDVGHEHVLDVDHADHVIEALAIDGQAAVAGVGERADQVVEADARRHGHDVAARDADVAGGLLAEMKQVAKHLPLGGRQVAGDRPRFLGFVDRLLDLRREASARDRRRRSDGACRATGASRRRPGASPSGRHLVWIGDAEPGQRADFARFHVGGFVSSIDGRSRAGAACRERGDAWHGARPARPLSAASASQTPWARTMSPSNSSGPAIFAQPQIVARRPSGRRGRWSACPCRAIGH